MYLFYLLKVFLSLSLTCFFNENYFIDADAWPISYNVLTVHKNSDYDEFRVKKIRLQNFRHSCTFLIINEVTNIQVFTRYLGHTKIE